MDLASLIERFQSPFLLAILFGLLAEHVQAEESGRELTLPQSITAVCLAGAAGIITALICMDIKALTSNQITVAIAISGACSRWLFKKAMSIFKSRVQKVLPMDDKEGENRGDNGC